MERDLYCNVPCCRLLRALPNLPSLAHLSSLRPCRCHRYHHPEPGLSVHACGGDAGDQPHHKLT